MKKLHIFIDGSWLFKICAARKVLGGMAVCPPFQLDFNKLTDALVDYACQKDPNKSGVERGSLVFSTSIFKLGLDFDNWLGLTPAQIRMIKAEVDARERFKEMACAAGYSDEAVFYVPIKGWIIKKYLDHKYQEKEVDASVVALFVKSSITASDDYHAVISGDRDMLPAFRVACPDFTKNIILVTTHPDEYEIEQRQSSWDLSSFGFTIPPYNLNLHAEDLLQGKYVYECHHCHKFFSQEKQKPEGHQPYCLEHRPRRAYPS